MKDDIRGINDHSIEAQTAPGWPGQAHPWEKAPSFSKKVTNGNYGLQENKSLGNQLELGSRLNQRSGRKPEADTHSLQSPVRQSGDQPTGGQGLASRRSSRLSTAGTRYTDESQMSEDTRAPRGNASPCRQRAAKGSREEEPLLHWTKSSRIWA